MADIKTIGTSIDRQFRNDINDNFKAINDSNNSLSQTVKSTESLAIEAKAISLKAETKAEQTQDQLDDIILKSGDSSSEVVQARGGESLLYKRLDKTDAQLADRATKSEVASKRDKSVPMMLTDLHTEVKQAMTGGSVAVVGLNAVGNENLKNGVLTPNNFSPLTGQMLLNTQSSQVLAVDNTGASFDWGQTKFNKDPSKNKGLLSVISVFIKKVGDFKVKIAKKKDNGKFSLVNEFTLKSTSLGLNVFYATRDFPEIIIEKDSYVGFVGLTGGANIAQTPGGLGSLYYSGEFTGDDVALSNTNNVISLNYTVVSSKSNDSLILTTKEIKGATKKVSFNQNNTVDKVDFVDSSGVIVRSDIFSYSTNLITEIRTLNTGEKMTIKHHLDTYETEVI